jgi:hypothetical protein
MRKHLALIIEHDDADKVGLVTFYDKPKTRLEKNTATPIQTFNKETGEFSTVGKEVSLGYVDFEDEDDLEERAAEEIQRKLREVDEKWVDKAGIELEELAA